MSIDGMYLGDICDHIDVVRTHVAHTHINDLYVEVMVGIFDLLPVIQIHMAGAVCSYWRSIVLLMKPRPIYNPLRDIIHAINNNEYTHDYSPIIKSIRDITDYMDDIPLEQVLGTKNYDIVSLYAADITSYSKMMKLCEDNSTRDLLYDIANNLYNKIPSFIVRIYRKRLKNEIMKFNKSAVQWYADKQITAGPKYHILTYLLWHGKDALLENGTPTISDIGRSLNKVKSVEAAELLVSMVPEATIIPKEGNIIKLIEENNIPMIKWWCAYSRRPGHIAFDVINSRNSFYFRTTEMAKIMEDYGGGRVSYHQGVICNYDNDIIGYLFQTRTIIKCSKHDISDMFSKRGSRERIELADILLNIPDVHNPGLCRLAILLDIIYNGIILSDTLLLDHVLRFDDSVNKYLFEKALDMKKKNNLLSREITNYIKINYGL